MEDLNKQEEPSFNIGYASSEANETLTDEIKRTKASDRTRSKNLTNHHRNFDSMASLEEQASKIYASHKHKVQLEYEKDLEAGFDILDVESVKTFSKEKVKYTPTGNTVLVKELPEQDKIGNLIVPDGASIEKKGIIIVAGLYAQVYQPGDVIAIKPSERGGIQAIKRVIEGVTFYEIDAHVISGIYEFIEVIKKRNAEL